MNHSGAEGQESISYQALLDENQAQSNEIQALKSEIESLRTHLAECEELKQAEEALLKSESRYRMLFTCMTEGFGLVEIIYDNNGNPYDYRFLEANPAYELYLGIKREQLLGKTMRETFPNVSSIHLEKCEKVVLSGQPINFEIFSQVANKYLDIYAFIPKKGKIALILRDITERKKTEDALQQAYEELQLKSEELEASYEELQAQSEELQAQNEELQVQREELQAQAVELEEAYEVLSKSEERYRTLFTNMTEGFALTEILYDRDGKPYDYRYLEINPAYERNLSVKRECLLGKNILEVFPNTSPTAIEKFCETALTGHSNQFEVFSQVINKYLDVYVFSPEKGKLALIFKDITERKKTEEELWESKAKLEAAIESMTDAVFISDVKGNLVEFNTAFATFHKFRNKKECYRTLFEYPDIIETYFPDGTLAPIDTWVVWRALRGEKGTDAEFIVRRKDTGETWIGSYNYAPIRDRDGMIIGAVLIGRDITERKRTEDALHQAYEELQAQSEELQAANEELQAQSEELQVQTEELQDAYEALSEREKQYRLLFTNMSEGFILGEPIYNEDGTPCDYRFLDVNPAFELQTGLTRERVLGKTIMELLNNPSRLAIEKYGEIALSGKSTHIEVFSQELDRYLDNYIFSPEKGKFAVIVRDITERKKLEEQTRQRAEELETVMEVAPVAIWIGHDPQSHDITGNRMANKFYEAEVGENVSANVTPVRRFFYNGCELTADELPMQQASLKNIDVRNAEFDVLLPSGEWRALLGSASPLHDAEGHVRGSVGTFIDITDRKQAEEALRKSEEHYRMLFTNMTESFALTEVIYDKDGRPSDYRYLETNPAYERNLGKKKEDLLGKNMLEVFPNTTPTTIKKLGEVALTGHSTQYEVFSQEANRYIDVFAFSPEKGKLAWIFRDITARKKAEAKLKETLENLEEKVKERTADLENAYNLLKESDERFRVAVKNSSLVLSQFDLDLRYTWIYNPHPDFNASMLIKKRGDELEHSDEMRRFTALKRQVLESGKGIRKEMSFSRSDGAHTYDTIIEPLYNDTGEVIGGTVSALDITERKKAEEALAKMEQIRIKEIHHRIKNNLQVISSLLDLQADTFSHLDVCKVPEVLEAFSESKNRVISMALIHEELYKGKNIDTLDFAAYLKKLTEDLLNSYDLGDNGNISLRLNLDQVYLNMDTAIPLGMIVNELVSNSFKHAFPAFREGQIQINLRKAQTSGAKNGISNSDEDCIENDCFNYILEVSDNGKGIPKDIDIESLNSLGLQLVNILVEQIDGRLEVKSDKGTEFNIWFNNIEM